MNRLIMLTVSILLLSGCHISDKPNYIYSERKIMNADIEQKNLLFMEKSSPLSEFFRIENKNLKSVVVYDAHRESVIALDSNFAYLKAGRKITLNSNEEKQKVIHDLNLMRASSENVQEVVSFGYLIEIKYENENIVSLIIANSASVNYQYVPVRIMNSKIDKIINIKKNDLNKIFSDLKVYPVL